jgi:hypothetical protein
MPANIVPIEGRRFRALYSIRRSNILLTYFVYYYFNILGEIHLKMTEPNFPISLKLLGEILNEICSNLTVEFQLCGFYHFRYQSIFSSKIYKIKNKSSTFDNFFSIPTPKELLALANIFPTTRFRSAWNRSKPAISKSGSSTPSKPGHKHS